MHNVHDSQVQYHHYIATKYFRRFKTGMIEILAKFLKYFAMKVSQRPCEFNVRKGGIRQTKISASKMYISIRDPFIPFLNHGAYLFEREQFKEIIQSFTDLLEAASEGNSRSYLFF